MRGPSHLPESRVGQCGEFEIAEETNEAFLIFLIHNEVSVQLSRRYFLTQALHIGSDPIPGVWYAFFATFLGAQTLQSPRRLNDPFTPHSTPCSIHLTALLYRERLEMMPVHRKFIKVQCQREPQPHAPASIAGVARSDAMGSSPANRVNGTTKVTPVTTPRPDREMYLLAGI